MKVTYSHVEDVHPDTTHVLFCANTFLGRPLERSNTRVLDFVEILNSLGDINEQIRSGSVWTETPDLPGLGDIPTEVVR